MLQQINRHKGLFIIVALFVFSVAYALWPRSVLVEVVKVWRGSMSIIINEIGKTRVIDRFIVSAPVAGYKRRFDYLVGDKVKKGNVVAILEPLRSRVLDPRSKAEAKAKVAAARASLLLAIAREKAAITEANLAARELKRIVKIYRKKLISVSAYDKANSKARQTHDNKRSARFAVRVAKFNLELAQTSLKFSAADKTSKFTEKVMLRAPVSGQILKIHHKSQGVVKTGQALIEIGNPGALEVVIDVLSVDAVRLQPGTRIQFKRWGGDKILSGVVRKVEPVGFTKVSALGVEEQRVLIVADISSPRKMWKRLGIGYSVDASFILWQGKNVVQVSSSALFKVRNHWAVFAVRNKRAVLVRVVPGRQAGLSTEILKGLSPGDIVVKHPDESVENNTRLRFKSWK